MTIQDNNGKVPTPAELFDYCLLISDLCENSLLDAKALRDENRRILGQMVECQKQFEREIQVLANKVAQQGEHLQANYLPAHVEKVSSDGKRALQEFRNNVSEITNVLKKEAKASAKIFWLRTGGAVVSGLATIAILLFAIHLVVPSMDEIQARWRAKGLQIVSFEGGDWIPVTSVQTLCNSVDPEKCAKYAKIR